MSNNNLIDAIEGFIVNHGPTNCYIGITQNVTNRFRQHQLIPANDTNPRDPRIVWFWDDAGSEQNARDIEQLFLDRHHDIIHGGPGGGGTNTRNVYVYRIVPGITNENV